MNEETCETCEWYYKEHCCNGSSEYCTEMVGKNDTCANWEELRSWNRKSRI